MKLFNKWIFLQLGLFAGVFLIEILFRFLGITSVILNLFLVVSFIVANTIFIKKYIISPITDLYNALTIIDFNSDIIDFSKLDMLEESGCSEIKNIISKFKYLIDILAERIDRINDEAYRSEHDHLTGCYNRAYLARVKTTYETSKSLFIIFIDVNNLKRMNDEFGHEAGDALLKTSAKKLSFWDDYGDVYRVGGDEFMIVIIDRDIDFCKELLKKWYPTVGQLNRNSDKFKCVLSYGVSFSTSSNKDFDVLEKKADDRMYDMKVALKKKFGEDLR